MIKSVRLLRNVGQFDSVSAGANLPMERITLIYAENGRGKTTLSAILRSLASGNALPILERRRLGTAHPPHIVIESSDSSDDAMFQNGAWTRTIPNISIFDDTFVNENVFSGLSVGTEHRQNLHELILGRKGVLLGQSLQGLVAKIETHNSDLRALGSAIPDHLRSGLSIDAFCNLPARPDIDKALEFAQRLLAAARQQDAVRETALLPEFVLPSFDLAAIQEALGRDLPALDEEALRRVEEHIDSIGPGGESWIADGMQRVTSNDLRACPFCAQELSGASIVDHYRQYFSDAYRDHLAELAQHIGRIESGHGGDVVAGVERTARVLGERRQFWAQYATIPELTLDTAFMARDWRAAREALLNALKAKQSSPLDAVHLSSAALALVAAFQDWNKGVAELNTEIVEANQAIALAKEQAAASNVGALTADVAQLQAVKNRHIPENAARCDAYLAEKGAKATTEKERDTAKADLDEYRRTAFPGYETAINQYLERFSAGFRLGQVVAADNRGGPTCTYNIVINETAVPVGGSPTEGEPSFRNTLSAGDRNTLALAFFFACLDQEPNLADRIVIVDDPISSLDDHRSLTTVEQIRQLSGLAHQVIVLSHAKGFLCRIWDKADKTARAAIQVIWDPSGSSLSSWNVDNDAITEHDRNHGLLREYSTNGGSNQREVARAIRFVLEGYLRVATPDHFPPSSLLGPFLNVCQQRIGKPNEVLNADDTRELGSLIEYANRFHHESNPAWETEVINDGELRGFVLRTLDFTRP